MVLQTIVFSKQARELKKQNSEQAATAFVSAAEHPCATFFPGQLLVDLNASIVGLLCGRHRKTREM
jgi:hypothetical protein